MKCFFLTAALVAASSATMFAAQDPSMQKLLTTAEKRADLFGGQGEPFHLGVEFVADSQTGVGPVDGHFDLKWEAKDRWWRQITLGGFKLTEIRAGSKLYTVRNAGFTPIAVREFLSLLDFAQVDRLRDTLVIKRQKRCKKNGVKAYCIKGDLVDGDKSERHDIVVSANSQILRDDWEAAPDQRRTEEFSNWVVLDKHRYYPGKLQLTVNGDKIISANVTTLTPAPFDRTLLTPPRETIVSK